MGNSKSKNKSDSNKSLSVTIKVTAIVILGPVAGIKLICISRSLGMPAKVCSEGVWKLKLEESKLPD